MKIYLSSADELVKEDIRSMYAQLSNPFTNGPRVYNWPGYTRINLDDIHTSNEEQNKLLLLEEI